MTPQIPTFTFLLLSSCAFAPSTDPDGGRADARRRFDASLQTDAAIDIQSDIPDASSPTIDAAPPPVPDAAPVNPPQPPTETLIISEIVDGTLPGGLPKFVELTNTGSEAVNLASYSLGVYSNGSATLNGGSSHMLSGSLMPSASYVISFENGDTPGASSFLGIYGTPADDLSFAAIINGDDTVVLFRGHASGTGADALIVDIYGEIGVDGTGQPWEYSNGFATRRQGSTSPTAVFDLNDWGFSGVDALEGVSSAVISATTSPGSHF